MIKVNRLLCPTDLSSESDEAWDRLFTASLAPHLGLATMNELNWHGLVRTPVHNVGEAIVREAVVQDVDLIVMRSRHRPRAQCYWVRPLRAFVVTRLVPYWSRTHASESG